MSLENRNGLSIYTATLDYPTGVNSTYAGNRGGLRKTPQAQAWFDKAVLDLRAQGFSAVPDKPYWCAIRYELSTVQMDIDGPAKGIIDAVARALSLEFRVEINTTKKRKKYRTKLVGFNDRWVGTVEEHKIRVDHYAQQGLTIRVILGRIANKEGFRTIEHLIQKQDWVLDLAKELAEGQYFVH